MFLLLEIVLCFCASSVCSEINIKTENESKELGRNCGLNITGQTSLKFRIKACNEVSIAFGNTMNNDKFIFKVLFGIEQNKFSQIQSGYRQSNVSWSGLDCTAYVNLWISWLIPYIKAGNGTQIGEYTFIMFGGFIHEEYLNFIEVASTSQTHWIFDFPVKPDNSCISAFPGLDYTTVDATTTSFKTANINETKNVTTETVCTCSCGSNNYTRITDDELLRKTEQLRSDLILDKKKTNRYKRSLMSTRDDRPSSKCIGSLSVVVLVIVFCIIVLMDFRHYASKIFPQKK